MIHKIYQKLIRVYKGNQVDDKGVGGRSISPLVDEKHMISSHEHIIRLHNDNIKLKIEKISFLMEKTVKLRYAEYKVIQDPEKYIQVFTNGTLTIRFRKDIIARSPEEARDKADLRLKLFINDCKIPGIAINGRSEQLSRDYAILGTDLAKKYVSERRKFFYFDQTDGRCRAEIDLSHARPEYETPHPHKGFLDADKSKKVFDDLNDGNIAYWGNILENERHSWDLPTVTKQKTDLLLNDFKESKQILAGYAEQIKLHLEVEKRTNKVLMQMEKHLGKLSR
jgi:hypothetical protein